MVKKNRKYYPAGLGKDDFPGWSPEYHDPDSVKQFKARLDPFLGHLIKKGAIDELSPAAGDLDAYFESTYGLTCGELDEQFVNNKVHIGNDISASEAELSLLEDTLSSVEADLYHDRKELSDLEAFTGRWRFRNLKGGKT